MFLNNILKFHDLSRVKVIEESSDLTAAYGTEELHITVQLSPVFSRILRTGLVIYHMYLTACSPYHTVDTSFLTVG